VHYTAVSTAYPGGAAFDSAASPPTSWTPSASSDLAFKTYVTRPMTSKSQCKKNGWRNYPLFKNQGQCVSFVERQRQS
jgi:hypothetical protein